MIKKLTLLTIILGFIFTSACAPSKTADPAPAPELTYDFTCTASHGANSISYRFRKFQMDARAYNMGIRNFVSVEVQVGDRFNTVDLDDAYADFNEKVIYINTINGAYKFKTDWATNGNVDSAITAELMGVPVTLTNVNCVK